MSPSGPIEGKHVSPPGQEQVKVDPTRSRTVQQDLIHVLLIQNFAQEQSLIPERPRLFPWVQRDKISAAKVLVLVQLALNSAVRL